MLLHVDAVGSSPLKYAWKRDGVLIDGQNGESLSMEEIVSSDAGVYSVEISNSVGITTSKGVDVVVIQPVAIASQPESTTVTSGGSTLLRVAATGTEPVTYEWYKDNGKISNSDTAVLSLTSVTSSVAGIIMVISNPAGKLKSDTATCS